MKSNNNTYIGAWGMGHGKVEARLARMRAREIEALAARCARARARKLEALEQRHIPCSTVEEIVAIYRAAAIAAVGRCGQLIDLSRLSARKKRNGRNPYTFRVRLTWCRALKRAAREARAEVYRAHTVRDSMATLADCAALVRDWTEGAANGVQIAIVPADYAATGDRGGWSGGERQARHAKECLIVHWSLSGSQRWHSALSADLQLLADCLRVARGGGSVHLGEWQEWRTSAERKAVMRLAQRMASGDSLMTDQPDRAEKALDAWQGVRRATRHQVRAGLAAEAADYLMLS